MKVFNLRNMKKGWFIGNFNPTIYKTDDFEVAVKYYKKDDYEKKHYHKIASEYTVIIDGKVLMFDKIFCKGDIVLVEPGEKTDFKALEDSINVVIKVPCISGDKYVVCEEEEDK